MNLEWTSHIKNCAKSLGFFACGVAKAEILSEDKIHYENYLKRGDFGEMDYLARNPEKRLNPALILENAKSVIVVLWDYSNYETSISPAGGGQGGGKIAKYACGEDYHEVIKPKLTQLEDEIRKLFPKCNMRSFVDASPILEKAWAVKAGLGFRGKNTLLINPEIGSYCNTGVILLDQELTYDTPLEITCNECSLCLENCPTGALENSYQLNARKCISYHNKGKERTTTVDFHGWAYGCDECQICCPYNRRGVSHTLSIELNTIANKGRVSKIYDNVIANVVKQSKSMDCFGTLCLAMTLLLAFETVPLHESRK
ncbi:MAG: tRNA epoxyqueuosine(34) reductase QueG [Bacteroidales bacterium]|nr:tRNA epoxyqueuosine(34) reductase QueG [Bacteroidales bacterium]